MSSSVVEESSCELIPGTTQAMDWLRLDHVVGASCRTLVTVAEQSLFLGDYAELTDHTFIGNFPRFGGHCKGQYLPTGAPRMRWSCPVCTFTLLH